MPLETDIINESYNLTMAYYQLHLVNGNLNLQISEEIEQIIGYSATELEKDSSLFFDNITEKTSSKADTFFFNKNYKTLFTFKNANGENVMLLNKIISNTKNNDETCVTGCLFNASSQLAIYNELKSKEEQYKNILNASNEAVFIFNVSTEELVVSNHVCSSLYLCDDIKNKVKVFGDLVKSVSDVDQLKFVNAIELAKNGKEDSFETISTKCDGSFFNSEITVKNVQISNISHVFISVTDITKIKTSEEVARYRFNLEKLIYEISADVINTSSFEVDGYIENSFNKLCQFTESNAAFIYLFQDKEQNIQLQHFWHDNIAPEELNIKKSFTVEELSEFYYDLHNKRIVQQVNLAQVKNDNLFINSLNEIRLNSFVALGLLYQGNVIGLFGIGSSVANKTWNDDEVRLLQVIGEIYISAIQRKEAVKVLLEGERSYREIYNASSDAIIVMDKDFLLLDVNHAFSELFEYEYHEFSSKYWRDLCAENQITNDDDAHDFIASNIDKPHMFEWIMREKSGKEFWAEISIKKAQIHGIERHIAIIRDISERKHTEQLYRKTEDRYKTIVQQLSDIIITIDEHRNILYCTPSINNIADVMPDWAVNQKLESLIVKEDIPKLEQIVASALENDGYFGSYELRFIKGDSVAYVDLIGNNMLNHPSIKGIVFTCRDITERKSTENRILEAVLKTEEKERERFAKNLHDDLGPLLSSLKMYLGMLSDVEKMDKKDFIISQLQDIVKEAIATTKDVSNDLSPHVLTNYGLASAVESFIGKIKSSVNIDFENKIKATRFSAIIETSLYRITKELLNNTIKHANAQNIELKIYENNTMLNFYYCDDGQGLKEELNEQSKKGMGLSNIISRAKTLNSTYNFKNTMGKGFCFEMQIPLS